jgi:hypothetical protein
MNAHAALRRRTLRLTVGTALTCALAIAASVHGPALAAPVQVERFTLVLALRGDSDQPVWSTVTATGAFTDFGTIGFGPDDPDGVHHDILTLSRGTIDLAEVANTDSFTFNPKTCTGSDHETGTYRLSGTGKYASATGTGSWHHNARIVAPLGPGCTPDSPHTVGLVFFAATGQIHPSS